MPEQAFAGLATLRAPSVSRHAVSLIPGTPRRYAAKGDAPREQFYQSIQAEHLTLN
jgi:hypothetical protein